MVPTVVVASLMRCGLTIWAATTLIFFLPNLTLGRDPRLARAFGLSTGADQALWQHYLLFLGNAIRLDFGISRTMAPARVMDLISLFLPWTIGLLTVSTVLAFVIGLLLGGLLAWPAAPRRLNWLAYLLVPLAAIPAYLLGLILVAVFAYWLRLAPLSGAMPTGILPSLTADFLSSVLRHAALPALCLILSSVGFWAVMARGTMVSLRGEDFILLAEANGLSERRRFLAYALRNALLPNVTGLGLSLGQALSGALLVEIVFSYPGMGLLLYRAVLGFDYNTIFGIVFIVSVAISLATLMLDLLYPCLDPRIRSRH